MNENKLISITANIPAKQLQQLYELLSDEVTPYALRVGKGENHHREITLYCDAENVAYFKNILEHEIQAEI